MFGRRNWLKRSEPLSLARVVRIEDGMSPSLKDHCENQLQSLDPGQAVKMWIPDIMTPSEISSALSELSAQGHIARLRTDGFWGTRPKNTCDYGRYMLIQRKGN